MSEFHQHRQDCKYHFAPLDVCSCVERNMLDRIEALERQIAAADKLAERSRRIIDGYGFTSDGNDTWREVAAVDLAELDDALAAYEATKEKSDG